MKLRKILTPVLTTIGACSVATPLVCLTSCAGDLVAKDYFNFNVAQSSGKTLYIERMYKDNYVQFPLNYVFDATAEFKALPEKERIVTPTVVFSKSDLDYSSIVINQCFGSYDESTNQVNVHVSVTIMQSYWDKTELSKGEEPKSTFSIKLTGTNWYQNNSGFSIELEAPTTK